MIKKVLFCATVDYHFKAFHLPYMKWFQERGWEVHVAASGRLQLPYCDKKFDLPIERSPFKLNNLKAYKELKKVIEQNKYDIIHAHTPMGGLLARLAARKSRKQGTKVIYTAHGFHFCKGSSLFNWIMYYPLEKWLAHYTDSLITINKEDYKLALSHRFKSRRIEHVHGVGVDTERFKPIQEEEKNRLREKYGYKKEDFLLYYVAELNKNKNQGMLIKSVSQIRDEIPKVRLLLVGDGKLMNVYKSMAREYGVEGIIDFLGFRRDIDEISNMCDVAVASSLREGLPVNIMEALACGIPVIATNNRGHRELVFSGRNGWLIPVGSTDLMNKYIINLRNSPQMKSFTGKNAREHIIYPYGIQNVIGEMTKIYEINGCDVSEATNKCDYTCIQCGGLSGNMS